MHITIDGFAPGWWLENVSPELLPIKIVNDENTIYRSLLHVKPEQKLNDDLLLMSIPSASLAQSRLL